MTESVGQAVAESSARQIANRLNRQSPGPLYRIAPDTFAWILDFGDGDFASVGEIEAFVRHQHRNCSGSVVVDTLHIDPQLAIGTSVSGEKKVAANLMVDEAISALDTSTSRKA